MVHNIKYKVRVNILKFLKFKIPNFWNCWIYSSSSNPMLIFYSSLELSHQDVSNDTKLMSLASIFCQQIILKEIYVFVNSERNYALNLILHLIFLLLISILLVVVLNIFLLLLILIIFIILEVSWDVVPLCFSYNY